MLRLKLTSPGVLLIVAVLCAGGVCLLDTFYLRPYVADEKDTALREFAVRAEGAGRQALQLEQDALLRSCRAWAGGGKLAGILTGPDPRHQFKAFAADAFGPAVSLGWLLDEGGRIVSVWSRSGPPPHLAEAPWLQKELPDSGLMEATNELIVFGRHVVQTAGAQPKTIGSLCLARYLDASLLELFTPSVGGPVVLVAAENVPQGALADESAAHAFWPTGKDSLAAAWVLRDVFGRPVGCFRAELPTIHINHQAAAARRMVLIVLSLSAASVLLLILGTHVLIAGPVVRLLKRLHMLEHGQVRPEDLSRDLHGEPLVLARRLESAFDKLAHISKTDQLTSLANRRHFEEVLHAFYHQARRYNRPLSLIVMDIDFFKAINDTGGHQAGDELLKTVAAAIEEACRKADLPARHGGDEFAILLPETATEDAVAVAERIRKTVTEREHYVNSVRVNVTISAGVTDLNGGEIGSPDAMLSLADRALYAAKERGRNQVVQAYELNGITWNSGTEAGNVNRLCKKLAGLDSQFKELFLQAIQEVMEILEQRDPHMADHAEKVQHYSVLIAKEMGLPERVARRIEVAAMLHDIGMLAMPDAVLLCPTSLDGRQLGLMRKHPLLSVRIMEGMQFLEQEIPAVRYHHERYDGSGYPEGITGAAIPLSARILAVADTFDAITSSRTFREAKTCAEAVQELQQAAGTQLDPAVVEAFVAVARQFGEDIFHVSESQGTPKARQELAEAVLEEA